MAGRSGNICTTLECHNRPDRHPMGFGCTAQRQACFVPLIVGSFGSLVYQTCKCSVCSMCSMMIFVNVVQHADVEVLVDNDIISGTWLECNGPGEQWWLASQPRAFPLIPAVG